MEREARDAPDRQTIGREGIPTIPFKDLRVGKKIGEGARAEVFVVRTADGRRHALKMPKPGQQRAVLREIQTHFDLLERAVSTRRHDITVASRMVLDFDSGATGFMMYLADCTLSDLLKSRHVWTPREFRIVFIDVIRAVQKLHLLGLVHADLSASNVLINHGGRSEISRALITDLDQVRRRGSAVDGAVTRARDACGYLPPGETRIDVYTDLYPVSRMMLHVSKHVRPPLDRHSLVSLVAMADASRDGTPRYRDMISRIRDMTSASSGTGKGTTASR